MTIVQYILLSYIAWLSAEGIVFVQYMTNALPIHGNIWYTDTFHILFLYEQISNGKIYIKFVSDTKLTILTSFITFTLTFLFFLNFFSFFLMVFAAGGGGE